MKYDYVKGYKAPLKSLPKDIRGVSLRGLVEGKLSNIANWWENPETNLVNNTVISFKESQDMLIIDLDIGDALPEKIMVIVNDYSQTYLKTDKKIE